MSLENVYYISQVLAVILILPTLVLLLVQGRQTEKQIEQSNLIARLDLSKQALGDFLSFLHRYYETPETTAIMNKAIYSSEALNEYEQEHFAGYMQAFYHLSEAGFELHERGMMSESTFLGGELFLRSLISWPRPRRVLSVILAARPQDDGYVKYVQSMFSSTLPGSFPKYLDAFQLNEPESSNAPQDGAGRMQAS